MIGNSIGFLTTSRVSLLPKRSKSMGKPAAHTCFGYSTLSSSLPRRPFSKIASNELNAYMYATHTCSARIIIML